MSVAIGCFRKIPVISVLLVFKMFRRKQHSCLLLFFGVESVRVQKAADYEARHCGHDGTEAVALFFTI